MKMEFWCGNNKLLENNISLLPRIGDNIYLYAYAPHYARNKYQVESVDWVYDRSETTTSDDQDWTIQVQLTK